VLCSLQGNLIVGFEVKPYSIQHQEVGVWNETCGPNCALHTCAGGGQFTQHAHQMIDVKKGGTVVWTYDIEWEKSTIKWASRWDVYLKMTDDKVHWFSIINSIVILVFLSAIVAMIFARVLKNDLNRCVRVCMCVCVCAFLSVMSTALANINADCPFSLFCPVMYTSSNACILAHDIESREGTH
jgi:hypothetical protein